MCERFQQVYTQDNHARLIVHMDDNDETAYTSQKPIDDNDAFIVGVSVGATDTLDQRQYTRSK
jgi:hypothetical protein